MQERPFSLLYSHSPGAVVTVGGCTLVNSVQKSPLCSASQTEIEKELIKQIHKKLQENGFVARIAKLTNDDTVHFGETVGIHKHYVDFRVASSKDISRSFASQDDSKNTTPAEHMRMRVYRDDFMPLLASLQMSATLMLSEVASINHLQYTARTDAAPQYTQFCFEPFGILFIDPLAAGKGKRLSTLNPSGPQWQKIYSSLANFICSLDEPCRLFAEMRKKSTEKTEEICSLYRYLGEVQTSEIRLEWTLATIGPFKNAIEYYTAWADTILRLIANRQIFNDFPDHADLVFRYLKELAKKGRFNPFHPRERELDTSRFYLKHSSSITEDNIIVDNEFNIVEIQDWAFARLVPGYEAFSPGAIKLRPQPYKPDGQEDGSSEGGINANEYIAATLEARRRPDLARYFRIREENICSLAMDLGAGKYQERGEFLAAFNKILRLAGEIEEGKEEEFCWQEWRGNQPDCQGQSCLIM
ncbi:hypothetical protein PISL3812_04473 [Talaromyces islandicus]|uniref:Aminoglycoside phosphotransferase domain-containing protein n=1 Tax=Talaromyces islandicus TaxID=28573 RepID=A0A0U1LW61_TALIS|nr:hypothetical protein PISL3812_04473 [Talaromyces islandicus]